MIDVTNSLTVVEVKGIPRGRLAELPRVEIRNHGNSPRLIVFQVGNQEVSLLAEEVIAATRNATNTARY
jgi:hypothetical protein